MFRQVSIFIFSLLCIACAQIESHEYDDNQGTNLKPNYNCSFSPPVLDKSKIIKMLQNNGSISSEMNNEEIDKIVNEYIKRKNNAYKECKKL